MRKRKPLIDEVRAKPLMGPDGRVEIPPKFRRQLGLRPGKQVHMTLDADGLHVWSLAARTRRVQAIARHYVPEGRSLSDELIAERIEEAKRE